MFKSKLEAYLALKNSGDLEKIDPAKKKRLQDEFEPQLPSKLDSAARGAGKMFTFGFQDEIVPYATKGLIGLSNLLPGPDIPQPTVEELRNEERQAVRVAKEANPKSFIAGSVVAGILQAIAMPLAAKTNLARLGTTAALAGTYGLGESEGETITEKAKDVGKAGAIGVGIDLALMGTGLGALRGLKTGVGQKIVKKFPVVEKIAQGIAPIQTKGASDVADQAVRQAQIETQSLTDFVEANGGFSKDTLNKAIAEGFPIPSKKLVDLKRLSILDDEIKNTGAPGILRKSATSNDAADQTRILLEQKFGIKPTPLTTPTLDGVEKVVSEHAKELQGKYASKIDLTDFQVPKPGLPTGQVTRDKVAGLNLRNVPANDEDIASLVQQAAQANKKIVENAYEPMSRQELIDLAEQYGLDERKMLSSWEKGKAWNRQEMVFLGDYLKDQSDVLLRLNDKVDLTKPAQKEAFVKGWMDYFADLSVFTGGKSEAGAALRFARNPKDPTLKSSLSVKDLSNIEKLLSNPKEAKFFQDFVKNEASGDIRAIHSYVRQFSKPFWEQAVDKAFYTSVNGLLSGPPTHFKNFVSNTSEIIQRPIITTGQVGLSAINALRGKEKITQVLEPYYQLKGFAASFGPALKNLQKTWKTNQSQFGGVGKYGLETGPTRVPPVRSKTAKAVIGWPGKALAASDEFFKTLNFGMSKYQMAYNKAVKEGGNIAEKTLQYIKDSPDDVLKKAYEDSLYYTYTNPLKGTARSLTGMIQKSPLRFVQPFTTTPINVMSRNFEKTPLGFVSLALRGKQLDAKRLEENIIKATLGTLATTGVGFGAYSKIKKSNKGKEQYQFTPQDVAMSSAVLSGIAGLYAEGSITGDAPKDPKEKALFYANKQPRSILFEFKDGTKKWISYAGIEPFNTVLGTTANVLGTFDTLNKNDAALAVAAGLTKQVLNASFMQGLSNLFDAYADPDKNIQKFASSLGFMMMPNSSLVRNVANTIDPTLRIGKTAGERIQAQIPFVRTEIPPIVDIFGNPVAFEGSPAQNMLTSIRTKTYNNSPAMKEIQRLGYSPSSPAESLSAYDKLTPETYYLLQKTKGKLFEKYLTNRLAQTGDSFGNIPPKIALETLEKIDQIASRNARKITMVDKIHPAVNKVVEAIIIQNQMGNADMVEKLNERLDFLLSKNVVELRPMGERAVKR